MINLIKRIIYRFTIPNDRNIGFGIGEIETIKNLLLEENYEKIGPLYDLLTNAEKSILITEIALDEDFSEPIQKWFYENQESFHSNLFVGVVFTRIAWVKRTGKFANELTDEEVQGFFQYLEKAFECLTFANQAKPEDSEPYARLIRVCMGLSEKEQAWRFYNKLKTMDSQHLQAHFFMWDILKEKWLGSDEEEMKFLHMCRDSKSQTLRVVYLDYIFDELLDIQENYSLTKSLNVFKERYREEIIDLYKKYRFESITSKDRYYLANYFSVFFYLMDEDYLRNKEIDKIGKNISEYPWSCFGAEGFRDLQLLKL
ncbi:hypothetical protein [Aureivirga sp. CE67]|uniref:hypothetical protein n=1 Tax=Aureivirga sp. CE67 TaxID=1788983 RepID=UPI0018C9505B|nr:hypothetical protein [Aureivirga sp. CE67]